MIIGRRDLDDVGANQVQALQSAQYADQLATGHAGNLGRTGTRRMRGVEHIDIDRQVERMVTDAVTDSFDDVVDTVRL